MFHARVDRSAMMHVYRSKVATNVYFMLDCSQKYAQTNTISTCVIHDCIINAHLCKTIGEIVCITCGHIISVADNVKIPCRCTYLADVSWLATLSW